MSQREKKYQDREYERRINRAFAQHCLMLLPAAVYLGASYWESGYVSIVGISLMASTLVIVFSILYWLIKRQTLAALRREAVVDNVYQPPEF